MKRQAVLATMVVGVAAFVFAQGASGAASGPERPGQESGQPLNRVVSQLTFPSPWVASCRGTLCSSPLISLPSITTPATSLNVDITVSISFDYTSTKGTGVVVVTWGTIGAGGQMAPASGYPIASRPSAGTGSTLVFGLHDVPGGGNVFGFTAKISSKGFPSLVTGTRMVVVVETSAV